MTHFIDPNGHDRDAITYGVFGQAHTIAPARGESANPYIKTLAPETGVTTGTSEPTGAQTAAVYGSGSNPYKPTVINDAQGNETKVSYGTSGHLEQAEAARAGLGGQPEQLHLTWSSGLLQTSLLGKAPNQQTIQYHYDARGNLTEVTPPTPMGPTVMTYDALDRLATHRDANGSEAIYHYDNLGRVKEVTYSDGSSFTYVYDAEGNLKEASGPTGATIYTYDALNRLASTTYGGQTITQDYYPDGQLKDITDAGGTVTYTYNTDGQLATISDPATRQLTNPITKEPAVVELHWDTDQIGGFPHGNLTETDYPISGGIEQQEFLKTTYTYDANDRVATITSIAKGKTLQGWKYSYVNAASGNRQTDLRQFVEGPASQQTTYTYDYMNRLTAARTMDNTGKTQLYKYLYCYNSCGASHPAAEEGFSNLLQKIATVGEGAPTTTDYHYNKDNELTTNTAGSFTYDKAGNMTSSPSYSMKFNVRDQLTELTLTGVPPLALAAQGTTNELLSTVGSTRLENSSLGVAATSELSGKAGTYYTRTPEGMLMDSRGPTGGNGKYYVTDDKDSVIRTTNNAGQATQTNPITYEPFGAPQAGATLPTFGFDGGYQNFSSELKTSNLIHFGERYFDPSLGAWTQQDRPNLADLAAVADQAQLAQVNLNAYGADDPVNESDPSGEMGMAGSETKAYQDEVKWCVHHPQEYYHNRKIYEKCQHAAKYANPGSDECHVWGSLIVLVGLPDVIPAVIANAAKGMGLGLLIKC